MVNDYRFEDLMKQIAKLQRTRIFSCPAADVEQKFDYGDKVVFEDADGIKFYGQIGVVDRYGTFEQDEEPSYDIFVSHRGDETLNSPYGLFLKHIRQSLLRKAEPDELRYILPCEG